MTINRSLPMKSSAQPEKPRANAPKPDPQEPHHDKIDWSAVGQAAVKGAYIGGFAAVGAVSAPGNWGTGLAVGLGAGSAAYAMKNPEAALAGGLVGLVAHSAQQRFGLLGIPAGIAFGALCAVTAELHRGI